MVVKCKMYITPREHSETFSPMEPLDQPEMHNIVYGAARVFCFVYTLVNELAFFFFSRLEPAWRVSFVHFGID